MHRTAALVPACAILLASLAFSQTWDVDRLPTELRPLIHVTAGAVPSFARDELSLTNPRAWPDSMEFAGMHCHLMVHAYRYDLEEVGTRLKDLKPGWGVWLSYIYGNWGPGEMTFGPAYGWDEKGRLFRKAWYEPDSINFIQTYLSYFDTGEILEYSHSRRPQRMHPGDPFLSFDEIFGRDGRMAGFSYETASGKQFWWMGQLLPEETWRRELRTFVIREKQRRP